MRAVCNYSDVLKGIRELDIRIKSGVSQAFKLLADAGLQYVIDALLASYENPASYAGYRKSQVRAAWTRSANLQRTIMASKANPRPSKFGMMAGIGDLRVLARRAPYWEEIEKGTFKYVGRDFKGYWIDEQGRKYRRPDGGGTSDLRVWGQHKWINTFFRAEKMTPKRPIMPHRFFETGAAKIALEVPTILRSVLNKVLG